MQRVHGKRACLAYVLITDELVRSHMPRPVISVDTIGRIQRTARSHESLADHLNTDEQVQLLLDRHDELLDRVQQQQASIDRMHDRLDDTPDRGGDVLKSIQQPEPVDLTGLDRRGSL